MFLLNYMQGRKYILLLTKILRVRPSIAHGMQERESFPDSYSVFRTQWYRIGLRVTSKIKTSVSRSNSIWCRYTRCARET
jgi:hypothetical protein